MRKIASSSEKGEKSKKLIFMNYLSIYLFQIQRDSSLGSKWFDLPAGEATEDAKRDLKILKMRGALDPKRFYKKEDMNQLPKFFQVWNYCMYGKSRIYFQALFSSLE